MKISLSLILDEIELEAHSHFSGAAQPMFSSVELYIPGEECPYKPDTLLLCPLSEAIAAKKLDGRSFLCTRDRMTDEQENEQSMAGITVVQRNIDLRLLFNLVQRVFAKVNNWVLDMEKSTARRGGLQELLDLSEPIFRNFISIQDSTFKLVAYTKNVPTTDLVMTRLVQFGYHPPVSMELFKQHRRIEQYRTSTEVIVSRDKATSEYDVVKKTFPISGSIFIMVIMICNNKALSTAVVELFNILIEYIQKYADYEIAQAGDSGGARTLILDILGKNVGSEEETRMRAAYCGFPFEGDFKLFVFAFEDEQNVPTARLVKSLKEVCGDDLVFTHGTHVLLLTSTPPDIHAFCQQLADSIDYVSFISGISNSFKCLWDMPLAYEQALVSIDVSSGLKAPLTEKLNGNAQFCLFSQTIVYHLIKAGYKVSPKIFDTSFFADALSLLREYDKQHHTEATKILRLYLENERRATTVSEMMNMHRNTILYHVERVKQLLGVSLDDVETRLRLLLAFKADDFEKL